MELDFIAANKLIQERRNQILYGAIFRYKPKPFAMLEKSCINIFFLNRLKTHNQLRVALLARDVSLCDLYNYIMTLLPALFNYFSRIVPNENDFF
jgi:hypothetical protein